MNEKLNINDKRYLKKEVTTRLLEVLAEDSTLNAPTKRAVEKELNLMYQQGAEEYYERTGNESIIFAVCPGITENKRSIEFIRKCSALKS